MFADLGRQGGGGGERKSGSAERPRPASPSQQQRELYNQRAQPLPDQPPSPPHREHDEEDDLDTGGARKGQKRRAPAPSSEWESGLNDIDEFEDFDGGPRAKKQRPDHDSKREFGRGVPAAAAPAAAAAAAAPEYNWPEEKSGGGGGGGGGEIRSNKVYKALDELEERLDAYERLPEAERWCPMCAITAFANVAQSATNSLTHVRSMSVIIGEIDAIPANRMLGDWRRWADAVKIKWDFEARHRIKENQQYGIRVGKPEWTIDCILYHYCRETINERMIEAAQIRDLHVITSKMKSELRAQNSDGTVTLNVKLLPAYLSYSKELRARLKEFKGSR